METGTVSIERDTERNKTMLIEIYNGTNKIYDHRMYLHTKGMKFNKRSYGKSFYSKKIDEIEKEELVSYCRKHKLKYMLIQECHIRDSNYRKEFLQDKNREWSICAYCGMHKKTSNITVDHIIPVDKAKKSAYAKWLLKRLHIDNVNSKRNLAAACKRCNSRKGTKMGLWVIRGYIGKSGALWAVRWIIRFILLLILLYVVSSNIF